ncbi:ArsR/SmtB family transcription factor [Paenibacillus sp. CAU 1782]
MSVNAPSRDVFDAFADPTRRQLIGMLAEAKDKPLHELTAGFSMGRTAIFKHLTILKEAGLVLDEKVGRETRFRLNAAPLREIHDWVAFYTKFWSPNMMRLNQIKHDWSNWCGELEKLLSR